MPFYRKRTPQQGHWPTEAESFSVSSMRNTAIPFIVTCALGACGPWPQVEAPAKTDTGAWPVLLPLEELQGLPGAQTFAQGEAQRLSDRAAALQARARLMRTSVPDVDAMDALRTRLAR